MTVSLDNPFTSIVITSLDGMPLAESGKMLLTATSTSLLSGACWNKERTSLEKWGELPFRIDVVRGKVQLKNLESSHQLMVTPLDGAGKPSGEAFPADPVDGTYSIQLGKNPTVWYLLQKGS
jgi:hypothetical protein